MIQRRFVEKDGFYYNTNTGKLWGICWVKRFNSYAISFRTDSTKGNNEQHMITPAWGTRVDDPLKLAPIVSVLAMCQFNMMAFADYVSQHPIQIDQWTDAIVSPTNSGGTVRFHSFNPTWVEVVEPPPRLSWLQRFVAWMFK